MNPRMTALLRAYRERGPEAQDQSLREFIARKDPHLFSHHPADPAFRDHVWEMGGLYFCKGCVMTAAGLLFGGVFFAATRWLGHLETMEVAGVFVLLLVPTVISHLLGLPRPWKHVSRFLLGFLLVSALCMLFVTDSWWVRLIIVGTYLAVKLPLESRRARVNEQVERGKNGSDGSAGRGGASV